MFPKLMQQLSITGIIIVHEIMNCNTMVRARYISRIIWQNYFTICYIKTTYQTHNQPIKNSHLFHLFLHINFELKKSYNRYLVIFVLLLIFKYYEAQIYTMYYMSVDIHLLSCSILQTIYVTTS